MTAYAEFTSGINLSGLPGVISTQFEAVRSLERGALAAAPTIKPTGLIWNRTDEGTYGEAWMRWNGAAFTVLLDPEATQINASGTVAWAADQPMGTHKLTGLAAGTANGHSVRYEQVILTSGANAMAADLAMGTHKITGLGTPTVSTDAATKGYVDSGPPVSGSASLSFVSGTTWSTNVTLAFQPTTITARFIHKDSGGSVLQTVAAQIFRSTVAGTGDTAAMPSASGAAGSGTFTPRSGTPVLGFTFACTTQTAPGGSTVTLVYDAK